MATTTTSLTPEQLHVLLEGPAATAPSGVVPNLQHPPNANATFALTLTLTLTFATLAVLMRMYTKLYVIRAIVLEDYVVIIGLLLFVTSTIPSVYTSKYGGGVHIWDVRLGSFRSLLYWTNITAILYCPLLFFVKLSILLQYLRIFVPNRKTNMTLYVAIHICIWSCFILYSVFTFIGIFQCTPREKIWNPLMTSGHCVNSGAAYLASAVFNVITDVAILVLPISSVWKLQMARRRKVLITAVFATGIFACVTSIMRTYYSWKIEKSQDVSYNVSLSLFWGFAEIAIGIMVSCAPIAPKFFRHFGPKIYRTLASKSKSTGNSNQKVNPSALTGKSDRFAKVKRHHLRGKSEMDLESTHSESRGRFPGSGRERGALDRPAEDSSIEKCGDDEIPHYPLPAATKRDDLESGLDDFWLGKKYGIDI